jgi:hypothetical protein
MEAPDFLSSADDSDPISQPHVEGDGNQVINKVMGGNVSTDIF